MTIGILGNPLFSILLKRTKAYRAVAGLSNPLAIFRYFWWIFYVYYDRAGISL